MAMFIDFIMPLPVSSTCAGKRDGKVRRHPDLRLLCGVIRPLSGIANVDANVISKFPAPDQ